MRTEKRDGFARIGEINGYRTPLLIDLRDVSEIKKFSFFIKIPEISKILRLKNKKDCNNFYKFKFVIRRGEGERIKTLILQGLSTREMVEKVIEERSKGFDALYLPGIATPQNTLLLIYLGADIIDNALALRNAYNGIYMTPERNYRLESLKELPCSCKSCKKYLKNYEFKNLSFKERFEFLSEHNTEMLKREVSLAINAINFEELRELVEAKSKNHPEMTAMLRYADKRAEFEEFTPTFRKSKFYATTEHSFNRIEVKRYFEKLREIYFPKSPTLLLLPCSAKKPYSLSKSHKNLKSKLSELIRGVNEIIISSPFLAPRELELIYPIAFYDTPTTGDWGRDEIEFVAERLSWFLTKFEEVIAYLHSGYRKIAEKACKISGVEIKFADDISELRNLLSKAGRCNFDLNSEIFRCMSEYQFGIEMGGIVKGKYPKLELYDKDFKVARIDTKYGMLDIYLPFAEKLIEERKYYVRIDEFEPKGSIFAVGILEADYSIRPNDIFVFENSEYIGIAQALMSGREMIEGEGIAGNVRRRYIKSQFEK